MSYFQGHQKRYNSYTHYIKTVFGTKVRKLSVDAGFTCPNRDATKSTGGCTYCNNDTFKPGYCQPVKSISDQLQEGIDFFAKPGNSTRFLAYFQAYSNTYAPVEKLKRTYYEALRNPKIAGLVIATRPDCIDEQILDLIEGLAQKYYIALEFGIESCNDATLKRINRCHTFKETTDALAVAAHRNIHIGAHLILGLPGEDTEMTLDHAKKISSLPIDTLKIHQLQIVKNTVMAKEFKTDPSFFHFFTVEEYVMLVIRFLEKLSPQIAIERFASQSPKEMLVSPSWGMKNFEITARIEQKMEELDTWQGRLFEKEQNRIVT